MQGQTKFPAGFGCDPTLLSGGDLPLGRANRRLERVAAGSPPPDAPPVASARPMPSRRLPTRRLAEIESQRAEAPEGRRLSTLWTSAALGVALASSLYFLNYF